MLIGPGSVIKPGITVSKPLPPVSYAVDSNTGIVNEGDTMSFTVNTTAVPDGTVLYWTVESIINAPSSRFEASSGSVTMSGGLAYFGVTPLVDHHTDGISGFKIYLRTEPSGTVVAQSNDKQIGDTSLSLVSGLFVSSSNSSLKIGETYWTLTSTNGFFNGGIIGMTIRLKDASGNYYSTTLHDHSYNGTFNISKVVGMPQPQTDWLWSTGGSEPGYNIVSVSEPTLPNTPWNLGSSYTIEFWMKANGPSTTQQGLVCQDGWFGNLEGGNRDNAILVALIGGTLAVGQCNGYDAIYCAEPTIGLWTHIAVVNTSGTTKIYYNGVEQTLTNYSVMRSAAYTNNYMPLYIGRLGGGYGGYFDGKITGVRITNQAQYSGNFTPAIIPTAITGHTKLLWSPDTGAFTTDSGDYNLAITNNSAVSNADYPAHGSLAFNGTSSRLAIGDGSTFNLGTTWTIEYWSKATTASTGTQYGVMGQQTSETSIDVFYINGFLATNNARGQTNGLCPEPTPGVWTHVAIVKTGSPTNTVKVFYNGVQQVSKAADFICNDTTHPLYIGDRANTGILWFPGELTNIRICKTAKYSTAFTPDILPTLDAGNTALLIRPSNITALVDEGDNNLAITNVGVTFNADYPV
jgi:hypothetical protein